MNGDLWRRVLLGQLESVFHVKTHQSIRRIRILKMEIHCSSVAGDRLGNFRSRSNDLGGCFGSQVKMDSPVYNRVCNKHHSNYIDHSRCSTL